MAGLVQNEQGTAGFALLQNSYRSLYAMAKNPYSKQYKKYVSVNKELQVFRINLTRYMPNTPVEGIKANDENNLAHFKKAVDGIHKLSIFLESMQITILLKQVLGSPSKKSKQAQKVDRYAKKTIVKLAMLQKKVAGLHREMDNTYQQVESLMNYSTKKSESKGKNFDRSCKSLTATPSLTMSTMSIASTSSSSSSSSSSCSSSGMFSSVSSSDASTYLSSKSAHMETLKKEASLLQHFTNKIAFLGDDPKIKTAFLEKREEISSSSENDSDSEEPMGLERDERQQRAHLYCLPCLCRCYHPRRPTE